MATFLFIFSSCEKEKVSSDLSSTLPILEHQSQTNLPNDISYDSNGDGFDDKTNQSTTKAAALPEDCCNCELRVWSNQPNFPVFFEETWIAQVWYEGCNGEQVIQVGAQTNAPGGGNTYTPSQNLYESYPFVVVDGDSDMDLRLYVGSNIPQSQLPIDINASVVCERSLTTSSGLTPLSLDLSCDDPVNGSSLGCGGFMSKIQLGYVNECAAIKLERN